MNFITSSRQGVCRLENNVVYINDNRDVFLTSCFTEFITAIKSNPEWSLQKNREFARLTIESRLPVITSKLQDVGRYLQANKLESTSEIVTLEGPLPNEEIVLFWAAIFAPSAQISEHSDLPTMDVKSNVEYVDPPEPRNVDRFDLDSNVRKWMLFNGYYRDETSDLNGAYVSEDPEKPIVLLAKVVFEKNQLRVLSNDNSIEFSKFELDVQERVNECGFADRILICILILMKPVDDIKVVTSRPYSNSRKYFAQPHFFDHTYSSMNLFESGIKCGSDVPDSVLRKTGYFSANLFRSNDACKKLIFTSTPVDTITIFRSSFHRRPTCPIDALPVRME